MEKQVKERSTIVRDAKAQPKAELNGTPVRRAWGEQEILALQEKARQYQRRYPAGGYQGL